MPSDGELSTSEAARILHRHPRTVREWCKRGQIPCIIRRGPKGQPRYLVLEDTINELHARIRSSFHAKLPLPSTFKPIEAVEAE